MKNRKIPQINPMLRNERDNLQNEPISGLNSEKLGIKSSYTKEGGVRSQNQYIKLNERDIMKSENESQVIEGKLKNKFMKACEIEEQRWLNANGITREEVIMSKADFDKVKEEYEIVK